MRVLLAEDQIQLATSLTQVLSQSGFAVDCVHDGFAADQLLQTEPFSLVILDIAMPRMEGWEVLRRLRARGNRVPVLMLTAHGTTEDRVRGLDLGADDYLPKPFELSELEARVRALLRRSQGQELVQIVVGKLSFDSVARSFTVDGEALALTPRERAVLEVLIMRAGRAIDKEALSAQVYSLIDPASPDAIEIYVHRLRKKIAGSGASLVTLRGLGYMLEAQADA